MTPMTTSTTPRLSPPRRRPTGLVLAGLLATLCAGGLDAARAEQIFVQVVGQTSSTIDDWYNPVASLDGVALDRHGLVEDFAWSVVSPRDAASGLPTGKRLHRALSVRVRMSAATTVLGYSLVSNENLTTVALLTFARDSATSAYVKTRQLTLTNAALASLSMYTTKEQGELVTWVDVSFTYQKIGIEDFVGFVSFEDDWETTSF